MKRRVNPYRVMGKGLDFLTHPYLWITILSVGWLTLGWNLWQWSDNGWLNGSGDADSGAAVGFIFWCIPTVVFLGVFVVNLFVWLRDDLPIALVRKSMEWEERNGVWIHRRHEWVEDE